MRLNRLECYGQKGASLLVSLVILTAITLASLVVLQRAHTQVRMVSNLQHRQGLESTALSTLNHIFSQLEASAQLQQVVFSLADQQFKQAENDATVSASIRFSQRFPNLLPTFSTTDPLMLEATVTRLPSPVTNVFYLKTTPGCGNFCAAAHYSLVVQVEAQSRGAAVRQELVLKRWLTVD